MADLQCQAEPLEVTVGQRFKLLCKGEIPTLSLEKLELRLDEADRYKLKQMGPPQVDASGLQLEVVSYKVGSHEIKALQLIDTEKSIVLGDVKLQVKSVQDPKEPVSEPYGPFGPAHFYPLLGLLLLLGALVLVTAPLFVDWRRRARRRKLMDLLDQQSFQYSAFQELHRVFRTLQRQHVFLVEPRAGSQLSPEELRKILEEISLAFRVYLARQFRVPAHAWGSAMTLSTLRDENRLSEEALDHLRSALRESERALAAKALNPLDLAQLLKLMKIASEKLEREVQIGRK